ncbi:MAG: hypothetical protein FK733_18055 [Asgard group archaeon]|nr:hypothetical protein [Asgard group archaeon]
MFEKDSYLQFNEMIKSIFRIDSYYNSRTFRVLNSNAYYHSIFQLQLDSLLLLLQSENKEIAALYEPHFETILGYMSIYKEYEFNSPKIRIERSIDEKWKKRQFIHIMRDFFAQEKPEFYIHYLGQMFLSEIPDIKISSWRFGQYPAHYHDKTKLKSMLTIVTNLVEYWNEFQQFTNLLEKYYPEGINKQGTHKIPRKKDICQLVLLYPYVPDLWLDLARSSKKEKDIITYLRIALCLDHTRYDIWKELIKLDPNYRNTNIPQLDDNLNVIINNKVNHAVKILEKEQQEEVARQVVDQVTTLKKRQDAFNEISQMMGSKGTTEAPPPPIAPASTSLPRYFEFLKSVPGTDHIKIFNNVEKAIAALPGKNIETIRSLEIGTQQAFDTGKLEAALHTLLSIVHISAQIGASKNLIQALCNLGIYFSNARRYDIARNYANDAKNIATKNNLLEEKLQALKVLGLIQANDSKNPQERITIMEETAETLRLLGREGERQQVLAQLKAFKEFADLLGSR